MDIMTYSTDVKQIILNIDDKLGYIIHLLTGNGHKPADELTNTEKSKL